MLSCAVIGCGAAGIAASTALRRSGLLVTCFELAADPGGIWGSDTRSSFSSRGLLSPVHPTMRCVISKDLMSFSDGRFDYTVPQFPHCSSVQRYLEKYAERMGVRGLVRFNTKVQSVRYDERAALWRLTTVNVVNGDVFEWLFDRVCVCTGNTQEPRYPKSMREALEPYVKEGGEVHHASHIKAFRQFKDKRVVVVGDGVTAWDYYWELRRCGADVYHSSCCSLHQQQPQQQKDQGGKEWGFTTISSSSDGGDVAMRAAASAALKLLLRTPGWRSDVAKGNHIVSNCLKFKSGAMLGGVASVGHLIACDGRGILFAELPRRDVDILEEAQQRLMAREKRKNGHGKRDEVFLDSVDAVIFATGYNQRYPFLDDEMRNVLEARQLLLSQRQEDGQGQQPCGLESTKIDTTTTTTRLAHDDDHHHHNNGLYLGTLYMRNPSIAFVGMQRELLPPFLLFEAQAKFISYAFTGRLTLPNNFNGLLLRQSELIERYPLLANLHHPRGLGLCSAVYFNVLQEELHVGSRNTYTACIMERQKWVLATGLLRLVHKLRSMAPLKRKKQHILFSNAV